MEIRVVLTHLDAGVIIGFLNRDDPHHGNAHDVISEAVNHNELLAVAATVYAECLVTPMRSGENLVRLVQDFFDRFPISVIEVDSAVAFEAARIRAQHASLRLPDAVVIATAAVSGADRLLTADGRWPLGAFRHFRTRIQRI